MPEKVIVVTGGSSGIGAAAGVLLSSRGHAVVLAARRQQALETVAARCAGAVHVVTADLTAREDVRRVVGEGLRVFGRIDVWINNAGQGITRAPSALTDDDIDLMMRVNVKTALYGMQEILPHFKERGDGHIINVSSMLARLPYAPLRSAYTGAKHFLNALTANLRDEIQETHPAIQVSLVSPGVVYTAFGENAVHGGPDSRHLPDGQTPEDVAAVIARVVETREEDVYTRAGAKQRVVEYFSRIGQDPV